MPQRIAASLAFIAFALCLFVGCFHTGNSFGTAVGRALAAMAVTFIIGLVVGTMAERMLRENLKTHEERLKNEATKVQSSGR